MWDANGVEDVCERDPVYHIMACRIRTYPDVGERFSDPFIVCDLEGDTDSLVIIDTGHGTAFEALRTECVTIFSGQGKATPKYLDEFGRPLYNAAHIIYTSVPAVRCATATACEAPPPVNPGGKILFHVAVRNDGNVYLSGCTLTLAEYNDESGAYERVNGASAQVVFSKDTIQESTYNQPDGKGGLTDTEPDYALAPGKTSVYAVSVSVPSDWKSGTHTVLFVASDGQVASDASAASFEGQSQDSTSFLTAAAEDYGVVEFSIEPDDYKAGTVRTAPTAPDDTSISYMDTVFVSEAAGDGDFVPSPVTVSEAGEALAVTPRRSGGSAFSQGSLPSTPAGRDASTVFRGGSPSRPSTTTRTTPTTGFGGTAATTTSSSSGSVPGGNAPVATSPAAGAATSAAPTGSIATEGVSEGVLGAAGTPQATQATQAVQTAQEAPLPDTGDASHGGALVAGLALMGAAALAYERRRAKWRATGSSTSAGSEYGREMRSWYERTAPRMMPVVRSSDDRECRYRQKEES